MSTGREYAQERRAPYGAIVLFCVGALLGARVEAAEHLLFSSAVAVEQSGLYRIALSLHLKENQGVWESFVVRRTIAATESRDGVRAATEESQVIAFNELVALGENGFPLLVLPRTNFNVLYLKVIDPRNPENTLGLSYPVDARPEKKKWGWLSLSIVGRGAGAFRLVDERGRAYACIKMEVNYQDYWGIKPVGLTVFQPDCSPEAESEGFPHRCQELTSKCSQAPPARSYTSYSDLQ